jgi:thiol-disulfide isomerase/thioredoxin
MPFRPLILWILVLTSVLAASCSGDGSTEATDRLPDLVVIDLETGDSRRLDEPQAAPQVINLWATWCAPCRSELPAFDAVADAAGSSITMLGVGVGENPGSAATLIDELEIGFRQSVDPGGDVNAAIGVSTLPATVFATADGEVLDVHSGALDAPGLALRIEQLFGVVVDV